MSAWSEKVVVIAGGSAGLGLSIANAFAAREARVVILGRNAASLKEAAANCESGKLEPRVADATNSVQLQTAVDEIRDQFGRIDVWVNNVGVSSRGSALASSPEQFRAAMETNFITAVHGTQAAAPAIIDAKGSLVFIGSLASKTASRFLGTYPSTKHAVAAYAHQLRLELKDDGVHVMLVCPGPLQREDAGTRYAAEAESLPDHAKQPGGGARLKGLDPKQVAEKIVRGCERRSPELVLPAKARFLFALAQCSPKLGDWLLGMSTK